MNTSKEEIKNETIKIVANDVIKHDEERQQLFLAARYLSILTSRLLEHEYYLSLPEERTTDLGYKEQIDKTRSKAKNAMRELLITLEIFGIRESVEDGSWDRINLRAGKIKNHEYVPTCRRTD